MTPNSRMIDPLLQCPLKMRHTLRTTSKPHLLTEIIPPLPANCALATGNTNFKCHAVANGKAIDACADADDYARGFMTEGERCTGAEIAIGEFLIVGYVGAADTCGLDLDLEFACGGLFDCACFLGGGLDFMVGYLWIWTWRWL